MGWKQVMAGEKVLAGPLPLSGWGSRGDVPSWRTKQAENPISSWVVFFRHFAVETHKMYEPSALTQRVVDSRSVDKGKGDKGPRATLSHCRALSRAKRMDDAWHHFGRMRQLARCPPASPSSHWAFERSCLAFEVVDLCPPPSNQWFLDWVWCLSYFIAYSNAGVVLTHGFEQQTTGGMVWRQFGAWRFSPPPAATGSAPTVGRTPPRTVRCCWGSLRQTPMAIVSRC